MAVIILSKDPVLRSTGSLVFDFSATEGIFQDTCFPIAEADF